MSEKKEDIWSFSRIDFTCLAGWHQHYIQKKEQENNPWGVAGNMLHDIMEDLAKEKITTEEARQLFRDNWWSFEPRFEPFMHYDMNELYYKKINNFFSKDKLLQGKTKHVERRVNFTLPSGAEMAGLIDREAIIKDKYNICDYKIANPKGSSWDTEKKKRQLYLYSEGVFQEDGFYPDQMRFIFFQQPDKKPNKDIIIDFKESELKETIEWAEGQIRELIGRKTTAERLNVKGLFLPNYEELIDPKTGQRNMYCAKICGFRNNCAFTDGDYLKQFKIPKNQEFIIK